MSYYSPEEIGAVVATMETDTSWGSRRDDLGRRSRHGQNPDLAPELAEIEPALEEQYGKGRAAEKRRAWVEHAAGEEHRPGLVPFCCNVKTREVEYRFPFPEQMLELATWRNQALGLTLARARRENNLIRIYRRASQAIAAGNRTAQDFIHCRAIRPWMVGLCDRCWKDIRPGDPIVRDRRHGLRWHEGCS